MTRPMRLMRPQTNAAPNSIVAYRLARRRTLSDRGLMEETIVEYCVLADTMRSLRYLVAAPSAHSQSKIFQPPHHPTVTLLVLMLRLLDRTRLMQLMMMM